MGSSFCCLMHSCHFHRHLPPLAEGVAELCHLQSRRISDDLTVTASRLREAIVCLRTVWDYSSSVESAAAPSLKQEDAHFGAERALARAERSKTLAGKINPASRAALAITALVCYNCKRGVGNEAPARTSLPKRRSLVLLQQLKVFAFSCEEDPATVLHPTVIAGLGDVTVCHSITSFLAHAA